MAALSDASRAHEEYRLRLEKDKDVELGAIEAHREVAEAQARMLAEALQSANIDIVGGDGAFFDRLVGAVGMGKSLDRFFERSKVAGAAVTDYQTGVANLREDLKEIATGVGGSPERLQSVTLAAFVAHLMGSADDNQKARLRKVLDVARELGVDGGTGGSES